MSNARSPREVCSTTIGTSGLTVLASFRFSRSNPADGDGLPARSGESSNWPGGPDAGRPASSASAGRPALRRPSRASRTPRRRSSALRCARSSLRRVQAARGRAGARAASWASRPRRRRRARAPRASRRRWPRCPRPRRRGQHGLALERAARRRLWPRLDELLLGLAGDLQVGLASRCPGARASGASGPTSRARARRRARRAPRSSRRRRRRRARPRGTRPRSRASSASASALADVLAQLVERVEAGLGGEVVVELGQLLGLDLLDRDRELGLLAGELGRRRSRRGT